MAISLAGSGRRRPACAIWFRLDRDDTRRCRIRPHAFSRRGRTAPVKSSSPTSFACGAIGAWRGIAREQLIIYELHIGSFTPAGDWQSAARELPALAGLGITCVELMPVAEFPGRFGWGYDGVNLFAPTRLYGCARRFPPLCRCGARTSASESS